MADNEALLMAAWKGNKKFRREGKILKVGVSVRRVEARKEARKGCGAEWGPGRNTRPWIGQKICTEEKKKETRHTKGGKGVCTWKIWVWVKGSSSGGAR